MIETYLREDNHPSKDIVDHRYVVIGQARAASFRARFVDRALELATEAFGWLALRIECYRVGHDWKEWHCLLCYKVQFPDHLLPSWCARKAPSVRVCERCEFVESLRK